MQHFLQPSANDFTAPIVPKRRVDGDELGLSQALASLRLEIVRTTKLDRQEYGELFAQRVVHDVLCKLWETKCKELRCYTPIRAPSVELAVRQIDDLSPRTKIEEFAALAAIASPLQAAHEIGLLYTGLLPKKMRSEASMFFTPPALAEHLVDMATNAGIDWLSARVLEPSCGSGTVLLAALSRMMDAHSKAGMPLPLETLQARLVGQEKDPFCAWIAQVLVDLFLLPIASLERKDLPALVSCCDTLQVPQIQAYDLVIGNPPFGTTKLSARQKDRFQRSIYGRANLPAIFVDQALSETVPDGLVCFIVPTSLVSGAYSRNARMLLRTVAHPVEACFVDERSGVFEGVTQSIALLSFRSGAASKPVAVRQITLSDADTFQEIELGTFTLSQDSEAPWILPRCIEQVEVVKGASRLTSSLADWGHRASTGPVVWNRFKDRLTVNPETSSIPFIWAESVEGDGKFTWSADRKGNQRWFRLERGEKKLQQSGPVFLFSVRHRPNRSDG